MVLNIDILVLCSGKSGSSTLYESFVRSGFKCIKVHSQEDYKKQFEEDSLFETIDNSSKKKKLFIIDVYRNPIERKISSFFEHIDKYVPNWRNISIIELIKIFNNDFLFKLEEYQSLDPILNHYKIINKKKFDFKKKYLKIEKNNKIFIKLLYNNIDEWNIILSKLLNKEINIVNFNLSVHKPYYHTYENFKKIYLIPKIYIHKLMNDDKHFRFFNDTYNQNEYIIKWAKRSY